MKTGILLSIAASVVALAMGGLIQPEPEITAPEVSASPERTVSEILIHQAREETYDGTFPVTVEVAGEMVEMSLGDYLTGVVLGEMPASFELEALKAQVVAARTYTLKHLTDGKTLSDDPTACQAYLPVDTTSAETLEKLQRAVEETDGQVLLYGGELITATYYSCSGGRTEDASAVWGGSVPYLTSVESPGEEFAPVYETTVTVETEAFLATLGVDTAEVTAVTYTPGGGVDTMVIGGESFTGKELRQKFELRSTMFKLEMGENMVTFIVRGNGHRVGMSQYGAQAMALEGATWQEILSRYYPGTANYQLS